MPTLGEWWPRLRLLGVAVITTLTLSGALLPWSPALPRDTTLDSSWITAVNEAVAREVPFGTRLVFTYGPYASVYTREYHPATAPLMWGGSLLLAAAFSTALLLIAAVARPALLVLFVLAIAGLMPGWDELLFAYVLLVGLTVYVRHPSPGAGTGERPALDAVALGFLLLPLGMLPLIKGSLLAPAGGQAVLCAAYLWWIGKRPLAALCVAVPAVAGMTFWLLAGQSLVALPTFFANLRHIIGGYTEAMSIGWNGKQILAYLAAAALLAFEAARNRERSLAERGFLLLSLGLVLFCAFKGGFVRHDPHALMASGTLGLAMLLLALARVPVSLAGVLMCVVAWSLIDSEFRGTTLRSLGVGIESAYRFGPPGGRQQPLEQALAERRKLLARECELPALAGTSDIYSYRQSCLFYSGNTWSPRPVLQSYSAYTPELARLDEQHLRGASAPDNVFLGLETIDGRLPALEDGHSWLTLLESYDLRSRAGAFLVLRRRAQPHPASPQREIYRAEHEMGDVIELPSGASAVLAEIDVRPSLLGRAAAILFKPPQVDLEVVSAAGKRQKYRFVPGSGRTSFVLSPVVHDTREFVMLAAQRPEFFAANRVASIRLRTHSRAYWARRFSVRLSEVELPSADPATSALLFDGPVEIAADAGAPVPCDGYLDSFNEVAPPTANLRAGSEMRAAGWMAVSAQDGVLADRVLLALRAPDGRRLFFSTRPLPRPDVGAHYGKPLLSLAGFETIVDVSALSGSYELNLGRVHEGRLTLCEPTRKLTITRAP